MLPFETIKVAWIKNAILKKSWNLTRNKSIIFPGSHVLKDSVFIGNQFIPYLSRETCNKQVAHTLTSFYLPLGSFLVIISLEPSIIDVTNRWKTNFRQLLFNLFQPTFLTKIWLNVFVTVWKILEKLSN